MPTPKERSNGVSAASIVARCSTQVLDADNEITTQLDGFGEERGAATQGVRPLAPHALFDIELLVGEPLPIVVNVLHIDVGIS